MNARELHKGYSVLTLTRQDLTNLGFTREQVEGLTEGEMLVNWVKSARILR